MTETKNTFRILFYIKRNALLRNGSAPIMGRITINGERAQFSTRLSVDPQVWDPHSGRVLGRRAPAERINERLDRIRMRLEQCYESLLDHAQHLTPNAVKNLFFGRGENLMNQLNLLGVDKALSVKAHRSSLHNQDKAYDQ